MTKLKIPLKGNTVPKKNSEQMVVLFAHVITIADMMMEKKNGSRKIVSAIATPVMIGNNLTILLIKI
jgi:hypothetical protein